MDISGTSPPVLGRIQPMAPAAAPAAGSADQGAVLRDLALVILDKTGKASDADKLAAYDTSSQLAAAGRFRDLGPDERRLLNEVGNSDTAQALVDARTAYTDKMTAAIQQAGATGAPHSQALGAAALKHFDSLSGFDQQVLFSSLNAPNRAGATPFASPSDWRDQMAAMGRVNPPADRVELSDAARAVVGAAAPNPSPAPTPYVSGSIASVRA